MSGQPSLFTLPLLLPFGMTPPSPSDDLFTDIENEEIENFAGPPEQIVLNDPSSGKLSTSDLLECVQDTSYDEEFTEDAEEALRLLLAQIIDELQFRNNGQRSVTENDARFLRELPEVARIFRKTSFLVDVDVAAFSSNAVKTTCFAINLANLMWLHALMFSSEHSQRGILFKNWPLRHIYLNSVGYNVGQLGFVTLHDLHCLLFNLPNVFRTKTLTALNVLSDPRIHFLVAQPNMFSPKIEVVSVDTLEKMLEESKNDYLRKFVIVQDMKLFIPMPLLLFIERVSYDQNADMEMLTGSTESGGTDKLNMLIEFLRAKSLPYEKLLSQDIHLVMSTRFKIKFSHTLSELDDMTSLRTVVWRNCRVHRSLYLCLSQQTNIVRSTMLDDHLSEVACACLDKSNGAVCVNNSLLTMAKVFRPLLNEFRSGPNLERKGPLCLYTILTFSGAVSRGMLRRQSDEEEALRHIYGVIEADFMRIPTSSICDKIKICLTVLVNEYDMHLKWPRWYDMYFADPNAVLMEIVEHGNAALACMWIGVEFKYRPSFEFSNDAFKAFYSLLCNTEDTSYIKQAITHLSDVPLSRIIDSLISSHCPISRLQNLVSTILSIDNLNEQGQVKYHSLFLGLKMVSCVEQEEQIYYYKILHNPQLIVEQLILNKRIQTLREVIACATQYLLALPEKLQQEDTLSRLGIDDLLRTYAEKALHFRKSPSAAQCQSAALLHASIFKDGDTFYPPAKIPREEDWIPNNLAVECLVCRKEFSVFTRRHHCRRCGRVVCNACSPKKLNLQGYNSPQKVCEPCFKFERQFGALDNDPSHSSSPIGEEKIGNRPLWTLDMDSAVNERIRDQAIFDTAPDIELCFSLLELHTENSTVPRFLVANANIMLKILRQRLVCPANFDYPEVTHIVKSLLLAAKVYFVHMGDLQGVRQCEELTSESVMLNQMAKSNFAPPQPNKPIRDVQDWKQIRNILLEQQNWELALEVSTKNGLECESIWYLWAMHALKMGDWPTARDKFSRSSLRRNANMLSGVLEILRSNVDKETPKGLAKFFQSNSKRDALTEKVTEECLYYIKMYGSGDQLFDFFVEHERIFEAVKTAYAKKIAPKKFVKRIYIPYLEHKEQALILKYMENVDLTLVGWKEYAHEICLYCSGNRYFEALYETQLWLKDYYRAALSCTMFFKMEAKSYADLKKNKHHLLTAIAHFEMASAASRAKNESSVVDRVIDPRRIEKYAKTVTLQLEVTDFVCKNTICSAHTFDSIPTLFGADEERLNVITLIVDACLSLTDALPLVSSILRTYCMDIETVCKRVVLGLTETGRERATISLIEYVRENYENKTEGESGGVDVGALVDVICAQVIRAKPRKPDTFLEFITNDQLKFDLTIECGYLKSAYLLAVKMKRKDLVERVRDAAQKLSKPLIEQICRSKLEAMSS